MATRRELRFDTLDDAVSDAEALLAKGYDKAGNWDLAQVCGHLANWLLYPIDGYPRQPVALRPLFWLLRNVAGRRMWRTMLAAGRMNDGVPTVPQSVPAPGGDDAAAVARLREAAARWQTHDGVLHASPCFGELTRDECVKGHLIHCAHHLSFLVPKS